MMDFLIKQSKLIAAMKNITIPMTLLERAELLPRLPQEGTRAAMTIVYDLEKEIRFTQQEIVEYEIEGITQGDFKGIAWNEKGINVIKNFSFTEIELSALINILDVLDKESRFPKTLISLAEIVYKSQP